MKALRLFTGNRLELLAKLLAKVLEVPLLSPLEQEIIVVQSKGMERWLSMELASHFGVCANCRFPFPNAFIHEIFQTVLPDLPATVVLEPEYATWKIMHVLPDHLDDPGFASLKHYLDHSPRDLRRLQLASQLAQIFDQYVLYRPELITRWEEGAEDHWQAVLWRDVVRGLETQHRAALGKAFLARIAQTAPGTFPLPQRVSLFGISYLPPFHLQMLGGLAALTEVNLFVLNPCREYWGEIASERTIGRVIARHQNAAHSPEELHLEQGNPLLASMGTLGRDFLELLASLPYEETSTFQEPGEEGLLSCLQSDILNLSNRAEDPGRKAVVRQDDRSFQVHSCHSPMREVEVLYDHLLDLFQQDRSLLPKDILVMAPAIEAYAPLIQAVFDTPEDERKRIPYSIADRSMRNESQVAGTFLAMLDLWDERLTAGQLLGLLESAAVQARFGLTDADVELIAAWTKEVRIRWGIDEQDRLRWLPHSFRENTWHAGLERLLLGYAMPGRGRDLFEGILPYDHIEGNEATALGCLIEFAEQLFQLYASFQRPRTLHQWSETLLEMLSRFFLPGEEALREFQAVRGVLLELATIQELTNFRDPVDIRVIKWHLDRHLERSGFGFGFLTGGVTFCSMLPMRSIPMRVICLLGMDGTAFPRQTRAPDFDLIAKHPRPGDRSTRNDDRYLFLEALISARDKFIISYTGQGIRDNSSIPPSVLVSELLDYIHRAFTFPGESAGKIHPGEDEEADAPQGVDGEGRGGPVAGAGARRPQRDESNHPERLVTKHRLQPFNPAYFQGDQGFFSYSDEGLKTVRCLLKEKNPPPPFMAAPLSAPEEVLKRVSLAHLGRFFSNPARFFLNQRLGIALDEQLVSLQETESFQVTGLEKHALGQTLMEARMEGHELTALYPSFKASGMLPHGTPGELTFHTMAREVEDFARRLEVHLRSGGLSPLLFEIPVGDFVVTGTLPSLYADHLVQYRYATIKAKDRLKVWLSHLVLNLSAPPGYPRRSLLAGLHDKKWCALAFAPAKDSAELLEHLLQIYWKGLSYPIRFFPETSYLYAKQLTAKGSSAESALARARANWTSGDFHRGEDQDPSFQLCFRSVEPLDSEFESLATAVFGPMLVHLSMSVQPI